MQLSVLSIADAPPAEPQNGDCIMVGTTPQGIFTDKAHHIAAFQDGAWTYLTPKAGWRSYVQDTAAFLIFDGSTWQALNGGGGGSETALKFGINTTADDTNRLVVKSPATLLDNQDAGHQLKINKSASSETASLLFQSGYTSHAEMGLTGDQDFHIKTSADGNNFRDGLIVDAATGAVMTPFGLNPRAMTTPTTNCGGPDSFYGLPSATSIVTGRSNLTLVANRIIFTAIYVDR